MRSIDWEMMPFFLAVARGGSLRSGARLLNANYGTVNRNIQALENSYGVRLFQRSRQGFALTEAGIALLPIAEQGEEILQKARRQIEGLDQAETGKIRFSMPPTLAYDVVAPMIHRFQEAYPDIQIELRLTSQIEDINRDETDVSLRGAFEVTDDVVARKLYPLGVGVYASETYLKNAMPNMGPGGEGLTWIGWPEGFLSANWVQQSAFPRAKLHHSASEGYMHVCLLRQNCGMSSLPVVFETLYPELRRVPGTEITLDRSLWILLHTELRRTIRVRRFVDFLTKEFQAIKPDMQGELYRQ